MTASTTVTAALTCVSSAQTFTPSAAAALQNNKQRRTNFDHLELVMDIKKRYVMKARQAADQTCSCSTVTQAASTVMVTVTAGATAQRYVNFASIKTQESKQIPSTSTVTSTLTITSTTAANGNAATTVTLTSTYTLPSPTSNGLKWYWYENNYSYAYSDPHSDPSLYIQNNFVRTGILQNWNYNSHGSINGVLQGYTGEYEFEQQTLLAQGFFYAKSAGTYTFSTGTAIDNELFIYSGAAALGSTPFSRSTAAYNAIRAASTPSTPGSYSMTLAAGEVVPIVFIHINGGGPGNNVFTITSPDGTTTDNLTGFFVLPCETSAFVAPKGDAVGILPAPVEGEAAFPIGHY